MGKYPEATEGSAAFITTGFRVDPVRSQSLPKSASVPLAMSTPPNNERRPKNWFKQEIRSVFPSKTSRNLDVPDGLPTSTNVPPINDSFLVARARENSPSDGPRIIADQKGSGE